jgi:hypothetical protein
MYWAMAKDQKETPPEREDTKPVQARIPKSLHVKFKAKVALAESDITSVLTELIEKWVNE